MKTKPNKTSVTDFLNSEPHLQRRKDCFEILQIMEEVTGCEPCMWGPSMVGFGSYHYRYASGREGDWFLCGFAPRKQNLVLYIMSGFSNAENLLSKLGKYKTGKACLYIKSLEDIDLDTLKVLISESVSDLKIKYPGTYC